MQFGFSVALASNFVLNILSLFSKDLVKCLRVISIQWKRLELVWFKRLKGAL